MEVTHEFPDFLRSRPQISRFSMEIDHKFSYIFWKSARHQVYLLFLIVQLAKDT